MYNNKWFVLQEWGRLVDESYLNVKNWCGLFTGCDVNNIVKINVYLTDLKNFRNVNEKMKLFFEKPYPARAAVEVSRLPKDVSIEMDAILYGKN